MRQIKTYLRSARHVIISFTAAAFLIAGYGFLIYGEESAAPLLLVLAYVILVPIALVTVPSRKRRS